MDDDAEAQKARDQEARDQEALANLRAAVEEIEPQSLERFVDLLKGDLADGQEIKISNSRNADLRVEDIRKGLEVVRALDQLSPVQRAALIMGASLHDPTNHYAGDFRRLALLRLLEQ